MTFDFTTGRLYLNATCKTDYYGKNSGMFMIDLENDLVLNLGKPAIARDRAATKVGDLYLSVLCAIPEESELPESGVTGILLNKGSCTGSCGRHHHPDSKSSPLQCHQSGSHLVLFRSYHCHGG